jgi:hypothetical protein
MKVEKKNQNPTGTYHNNLVIWFFLFPSKYGEFGPFFS